ALASTLTRIEAWPTVSSDSNTVDAIKSLKERIRYSFPRKSACFENDAYRELSDAIVNLEKTSTPPDGTGVRAVIESCSAMANRVIGSSKSR
ncbi:MAG: hypothetical protein ABSA49_18185, partial [Rhizomicrobium sp.]